MSSNGQIQPLHGWPLLGTKGTRLERLEMAYHSIFLSFDVCYVLFTVGDNFVGGQFQDAALAQEGLQSTLASQGRTVARRDVVTSEAEVPAFELWTLLGCRESQSHTPSGGELQMH